MPLATHTSELTTNHSQYARQLGAPTQYYYEAIEVKVSAPATITFISNSSLDMYGYFYNNTFDPSYAPLNLMAFDDDSAGSAQFYLQVALDPSQVYILVVTTSSANVQGPFSVSAYGSGATMEFNFTDIRPFGR